VGLRGTLYQLFYFAEAGILARQMQLRNIQHLHNHLAQASCTVAMLAAEWGGFTFSFTMHGPYIFFEPYRWRLDKKIEKALFVVCISHYCRSQGMLFSSPKHWGKMHVIHCGVEPFLFPLVSQKEGKENLLYVGRLSASKGLPILLESLVILKTSHPNLTLTVVGDGEDRAAIESMVVELGLPKNVKFVGYQSQAEVRQHLQQSDVFVLPSFAEGIPVVLMEAMAAGLPVVATQIAGVSELVADGISGYLVPPGEPNLLAERLEKLLGDSQLRERLGKAGRAKVERDFNLSQEVARLHNLMSAALASQEAGKDQ
jgi:glycosyltransferase involved in cell wall biosynthesis